MPNKIFIEPFPKNLETKEINNIFNINKNFICKNNNTFSLIFNENTEIFSLSKNEFAMINIDCFFKFKIDYSEEKSIFYLNCGLLNIRKNNLKINKNCLKNYMNFIDVNRFQLSNKLINKEYLINIPTIESEITYFEFFTFNFKTNYLLIGDEIGLIHIFKTDEENWRSNPKKNLIKIKTINFHNSQIISINYNKELNLFCSFDKNKLITIFNFPDCKILSVLKEVFSIKFCFLISSPIVGILIYTNDIVLKFKTFEGIELYKIFIFGLKQPKIILNQYDFNNYLVCLGFDNKEIKIFQIPNLIEIGKNNNEINDENIKKFNKISFDFEIDSFSISPNLDCIVGINIENKHIQTFY